MDKTYAVLEGGGPVEFVTAKLRERETRKAGLLKRHKSRKDERDQTVSRRELLHRSKEEVRGLIAQVQGNGDHDVFRLRARLSSQLKTLVQGLFVASLVEQPRAATMWRHGKQKRGRCFLVLLRNGCARVIYPAAADPSTHEQQIIVWPGHGRPPSMSFDSPSLDLSHAFRLARIEKPGPCRAHRASGSCRPWHVRDPASRFTDAFWQEAGGRHEDRAQGVIGRGSQPRPRDHGRTDGRDPCRGRRPQLSPGLRLHLLTRFAARPRQPRVGQQPDRLARGAHHPRGRRRARSTGYKMDGRHRAVHSSTCCRYPLDELAQMPTAQFWPFPPPASAASEDAEERSVELYLHATRVLRVEEHGARVAGTEAVLQGASHGVAVPSRAGP